MYYSNTLEKKFGYTIPTTNFPKILFLKNIIYHEDEQIVRNGFQSIRQGKEHIVWIKKTVLIMVFTLGIYENENSNSIDKYNSFEFSCFMIFFRS